MGHIMHNTTARKRNKNGKTKTVYEYEFLVLLPLRPSLLFSPSLSRHVSLLRVASSAQPSSAALRHVLTPFVSFVLCVASGCFLFGLLDMFRTLLFPWIACCTLVPGILVFDSPTSINSILIFGFSLAHRRL